MVEKIAAGNWKMNGTSADLATLATIAAAVPAGITGLICTSAPLLSRAAQAADGTALHVGGQDCHANESGAHTGDTSAPMLADAGADFVILGHSERRADHGEDSALIAEKVVSARAAKLRPIVCVGETLDEREAGKTLDVVLAQFEGSLPDNTATGLVIAYEPVWAIGTGKVATPEAIGDVHAALHAACERRFGDEGRDIPLLYGGSVKPSNAAEIFAVPHVDGGLVGGASLKSADFIPIMEALAAS